MSKHRLGKRVARVRPSKPNRDDVLRSLLIREAHESWKTFEGNYDRCVRDLNTLSRLLEELLEELKWLD